MFLSRLVSGARCGIRLYRFHLLWQRKITYRMSSRPCKKPWQLQWQRYRIFNQMLRYCTNVFSLSSICLVLSFSELIYLLQLELGAGVVILKSLRHKATYFSWFGLELFCLLLGPPGFNCWFSSAPVFQWCCSTPQGSPGVGRNTFLSSPHLCFIIVFICDLFV